MGYLVIIQLGKVLMSYLKAPLMIFGLEPDPSL